MAQVKNMIVEILFVAILLFGTIAFALVTILLNEVAKQKMQASYPAQDTIELVVSGDPAEGGTFISALVNVHGYHFAPEKLDSDGKAIPCFYKTKVGVTDVDVRVSNAIIPDDTPNYSPKKGLASYIRKRWGLFWVSLFWPIRHIHYFPLIKARLAKGPQKEGGTLTDLIETEKEPIKVSNLRWKFPRPIYVKEAEASDLLKVSLVLYVNFQVVEPTKPVLTYGGSFFTELESTVSSLVAGKISENSQPDFIKKFPKGPTPEFFNEVLSIINPALITQFGVEVVFGYILEAEYDKTAEEAERAAEIANLEGQAEINRKTKQGDAEIALAERQAKAKIALAGGEAQAISTIATAQAGAFAAKLAAVGPNTGILMEQIRTDGLTGFKGTVLSLGGQGAGIMVNAPAEPPKASVSTPPVEPPKAPVPTETKEKAGKKPKDRGII